MKKIRMFSKNGDGPGYRFENKTDETEIYLYDEIGGWFGIDAQEFVKDLKEITGDIIVRINSPGGSVFDGMAIHNAIKDHNGNKTVIIDGLAASAASYIALAGDTVKMNQGAFLMVHNAMSCMCGNAVDFHKEAELLDKVDEQIAGFYVRKTGKELEDVKAKMSDETWFTAEEALEYGLIDEIIEKAKPAENLFDLAVFNKVPDSLIQSEDRETRQPKDYEKALRDAGMTRREAKAVLAEGIKALDESEETTIPKLDKNMDIAMCEAELELGVIKL